MGKEKIPIIQKLYKVFNETLDGCALAQHKILERVTTHALDAAVQIEREKTKQLELQYKIKQLKD